MKNTRLTDRILAGIARAVSFVEAGEGSSAWTDDELEEIADAGEWVDAIRAQRAHGKAAAAAAPRLRTAKPSRST